jgi:hypothetical protein
MILMEVNDLIFRNWQTLRRGEIISRLQHLPYHHAEAKALRAILSIIEDQSMLNQG